MKDQNHALVIFAVAFVLTLVCLPLQGFSMGPMEGNIDRMGSDYSNFDLSTANPKLCQDSCARDPKCKAWTYVKPNTIQGPRSRCWLKNSIPPAQKNTCCISGIKSVRID